MNNRSVKLTMVQEGQSVVYRQYLQGYSSTNNQFLQAEASAKGLRIAGLIGKDFNFDYYSSRRTYI